MKDIHNFPPCSVFPVVCILFYVLFSRFLVKKGAVSRILKMQNKAKFKIPQTAVTLFTPSTNKNTLRSPQPKNKAKQTQITSAETQTEARRRKSPNYLHNIICHLVCTKKMTNKPNFLNCKITISSYWIAGCWKPKAGSSEKNEPKQTQYELNDVQVSRLRSKIQPRADPAKIKGRCLPGTGPSIEKLICSGPYPSPRLALPHPTAAPLLTELNYNRIRPLMTTQKYTIPKFLKWCAK